MNINSDFAKAVVLDTQAMAWQPSPLMGVERKMLERIGNELARATSLVRYEPGSSFSEHVHGGGEEFLVLEGTFSDEHGHYGPGTYVRNPPGSRHRPYSQSGCTIFVKLQQFLPADDARLVISTLDRPFAATSWPGVSLMPLHHYQQEEVLLLKLAPKAELPAGVMSLAEVLVLDGAFGPYRKGFWLRDPALGEGAWHSETGCLCLVKKTLVMTRLTELNLKKN